MESLVRTPPQPAWEMPVAGDSSLAAIEHREPGESASVPSLPLGARPEIACAIAERSDQTSAAFGADLASGKRYGLGREEPTYYYINLLSLFGDKVPGSTIRTWAERAAEGRSAAIGAFERRLAQAGDRFDKERRCTGERPALMPDLVLQGWDEIDLGALRERHGGLLVALFHYGNHREVFLDLASLALPYVAPVAKHAYFSCTELIARGPEPFENAMRLIAVEDPRVGRQLLSGLRGGRIGLIYVDGNMGPEGDRVEEGAAEVEFLGRRIRVKLGIARLSRALRVPVLPLFVDRPHADADRASVRAGSLLPPPVDDQGQASMMQRLYDGLAAAVATDAAAWEFAFCLHRWIVDQRPATSLGRAPAAAPLTMPPDRVALLSREEQDYWVHVGCQRAYALPTWARGLYGWLGSRRASADDILAWLQRRGAQAGDARKLLSELLRRDLLVEATSA